MGEITHCYDFIYVIMFVMYGLKEGLLSLIKKKEIIDQGCRIYSTIMMIFILCMCVNLMMIGLYE